MSDDEFSEVVNRCESYGEAAVELGLHLNTVATRAKSLGIIKKNGGQRQEFALQDILNGLHPQYPTVRLKRRLVKEGMLKHECVECGISDWNSKPITLELDHIDGTRSNHALNNLRLLCPNCHSQTITYKAKNKKAKNK